MRRLLLAFTCALTVLMDGAPVTARSAMDDELRTYITVLRHLKEMYIDEIPPDTLMHAGVRGILRALDPASEVTFDEASAHEPASWRQSVVAFEKIARTIDRHSFYAVGVDTLIRFGIAGVMSVLDPDTVFMEKIFLETFNISVRGEYGGLGFRIQVVRPDSAIAVWSLLHKQTPAARAGVKSGDIIIAIDDTATTPMSASDAAGKMRGIAGTPTTLTLKRAGVEDPFDITIVRQKVHVESVPYYGMSSDGIGYIKLDQFQQNSSGEVRTALENLIARGLKGLIFDLRGNGGGYLQEAVKIADLFLPKDRLVVYTAGRAYRDTSKYSTRQDPTYAEGPLVILVDGASASASEIVSGAIQDWDRGLVMGSPTVGKGSVQQPVPIGDLAELKLTIGAYFIPSGRSIDKRMRKDSTLLALSTQEFRTRIRNRIVRGGRGITPDISTSHRRRTPLFAQLAGWRTLNSQFFRFARQAHLNYPDLTPEFVADDRVLKEFRRFVEDREFDYVSDIEFRLKRLENRVTSEEDGDILNKPLRRLKEEIDEIEENHWDENEDIIKWKLTFDILEKAFGLRTAYAYDATVDPQILRAREVLNDPAEYESWFQRPEIGVPDDEVIAAATADTSNLENRDAEPALAASVDSEADSTTLALAAVEEPVAHAEGVPYYTMLAGAIGYVRVDQFQQGSSGEVQKAIEDLIGRDMKGLIFDLRGNEGDDRREAIQIADLFLPKDRLIVYEAGRANKDTTLYFTHRQAIYGEGPLVVLVDGASAGASEIVSGAIQDWDRGLIVGSPTMGRGSIQKESLPIGPRAKLKLTTRAYFTPSDRPIDRRMRSDSTLLAQSKREFKTRVRNRIVRGGRGIKPDIASSPSRRMPLYRQLAEGDGPDGQFARFARQVHLTHPDLTPDFVADDRILREFRRLAQEGRFDYVSDVEVLLKRLEEKADEEEEMDRLGKSLRRLKKEIDRIEEKHWEANEEIIARRLTFDSLEEVFGLGAAYAYDSTVDPQILRAKEVLNDPAEYESWFQRLEIGVSDEDVIAAAADTSGLHSHDAGLSGVGPAGHPEEDGSHH